MAQNTLVAVLSRKAIHITSALIPLFYLLMLSREGTLLALLICTLVTFLIELLRGILTPFRNLFEQVVGYMLRSAESKTLTGATYVIVGSFLTVLTFSREIAITALFILSISDTMASLIGRNIPIVRIGGKSLGGSLAFFVSALVIARLMHIPWSAAEAGAITGTVVEAAPLRLGNFAIDDNLSVPLMVGLVMTALVEYARVPF